MRPRGGVDRWTVVEIALTVLVVGFVLWPVTTSPTELLAGELDAPYHAWLGWRLAMLWGHGDLFTWVIPDAVAPNGLDLRLIDGLLPGAVTAACNLITGGHLIFSYNLALAAGIAADVWAGRSLGRVLSSRRWVWFACGVAFATAPALAASAHAHIAFVYAFALPLLLREAILVARGDVEVRFGRIAALLGLAFLCSAYHLVFGALLFLVVIVSFPRSAVWTRVTWARLVAAFVLAGIVLLPFISARLAYERDERAAGAPDVVRLRESVAFSADAVGLVTPNDGLWVDLPVPRADIGPQLYAHLRPAFAGFALLVGLVLVCFARRPERRPLLITATVLWVLSLGPVLHVAGTMIGGDLDHPSWFMPYRWLQALPGLGALRAPTRVSYALAAVLAAALAVGVDAFLDRFVDRPSRADVVAWAVAAAGVVLVAASLTSPMRTTDLAVSPATRTRFDAMAAGTEGIGRDGVLIVPWGCRLDDPRIVALQSLHHQPNIGCNPPPTATRWWSGIGAWARSPDLAALRCDPAHIDQRPVPFDAANVPDLDVERMRHDLGVRYVIVDLGLLGEAESSAFRPSVPGEPCGHVRDAIATLERYVHTSDGTWVVVDLATPVAR